METPPWNVLKFFSTTRTALKSHLWKLQPNQSGDVDYVRAQTQESARHTFVSDTAVGAPADQTRPLRGKMQPPARNIPDGR